MKSFTAYKIDWTEYERGWGSRPDGTTLHNSKEIADAYIDDFIIEQTKRYGKTAPDEYTSPGTPELIEINEEIHEALERVNSFWISYNGSWKLGKKYILPKKQELTYEI